MGSQCTQETVKMDLLFEELLFGTKQQNRRVDRIGKSIFYKTKCFSFEFEITEDRCVFLFSKKIPKKKNLRASTYCSKVRDPSP